MAAPAYHHVWRFADVQRRALLEIENTRLVICVELSRSNAGNDRHYGSAHSQGNVAQHREQVSLPSARIIRPSTKASSRRVQSIPASRRARGAILIISKFSKRDSALCCCRSGYRVKNGKVNSYETVDTGRYWPCVSACPLQLRQHIPMSQAG